ncbi:MAG: hypothetical protein IH571_05080, partial [Acholeplasmataceae bacterium]|nr:hypothetical protein [Acholeplasmataceae bacterium]
MKKFTFSLMLLCALFVMCTPPVQANGQADYPVGKNYLDLRNLVVYDDGNYMANTALPIFVKVDQPYTLVLGYEFLGQHASYIDQFTVVIVDVMNVHDGYDFIDDMQNERAYIEFTPDTEWIHLRNLPCMPESYEAMLYEGTYAHFPGFEPYLKAEEKLILYGGLAIDYDERLSLPQIQSYITSKDPLGNVLTVSLIADEYTHSTQLPGTYQMIFSSIYNSIEKWFYLDVRVFDITAPIITIPSSLQISYSQRLTLIEIKQQIQVFDNVDDLSHEDLVVLSDTYSGATT